MEYLLDCLGHLLPYLTEPGPVQNVTAKALNSTAVEVSWVKPVEEPGPVIYKVFFDDMIVHATHEGCSLEGKSTLYSMGYF